MTNNKTKLGSKTAKDGFKNEKEVENTFNDWENNTLAQDWLVAMGYDIKDIEYVKAQRIKGSYKADIQVSVSVVIKLKSLTDHQNIQVKLVSNKKGFNQIDKRWLAKYKELWSIPQDVFEILQYYTGEEKPYKKGTKDKRRMFIDEMDVDKQKKLMDFLNKNKVLIISDILKGRKEFSAEWMLVILKDTPDTKWALEPINVVLNLYAQGDIIITKRGNIHIGNITMQRKGGDGGRITANMLQFKIDPTLLFDIKKGL